MSDNIINLYANTDQVMIDAIDRIVVELHNKKKDIEGAQKLILTGCGPQCGTTSTCIGLGIAFAASRWNTIIVDCDFRRNSEYKKLNDETDKGLSDFLAIESEIKESDYQDIIYKTNIDNLSYIPCGKFMASPARLLCASTMKKLLSYLNEKYDYVIFDFPAVSVVPDAQILFDDADGIILVSALEDVRKKQIKDAKRKVEPYIEKYYGMIINKIDIKLYKRSVTKYDYYFTDKKGKQSLGGSVRKNKKKLQSLSKNKYMQGEV